MDKTYHMTNNMKELDNITKEDIEKACEEVLRRHKFESSRIRGLRGCITRGAVDINDFSHCGNNDCPSCNLYTKTFINSVNNLKENG